MGELVVATFNLHVGLDGWGVPFDAVEACAALEADVLVLQEAFTSEADGSLAGAVAAALDYHVLPVPLAPARRFPVAWHHRGTGRSRWGPRSTSPARPLVVDPAPGVPRARRRRRRWRGPARLGTAERGTWDLAVLHRSPVARTSVLSLPQLPRDYAARRVALVELETPSGAFTVAGTHLGHLRHGSARQIRALSRLLRDVEGPAALLGDMNCFGPLLVGLLPGWRRATRGPSWPSWRPLVQPDHVLVNAAVRHASGEILRVGASDHHPVRARVRW